MATQPQQDWLDTDFYATLGVPANASDAEIKKAYKRLARELHPDTNPDNPDAEERFKAVSRAKEVVGDPEARKAYDEFRAASRAAPRSGARGFSPGASPFPGQGTFVFSTEDLAGFDLSDLLAGFFAPGTARPARAPGSHGGRSGSGTGSATGQAGAGRQRGPAPRGGDRYAHLSLDFVDAVMGIETTLTVGDRQIKARLPAGVEDGQTIRLRGKGQPAPRGSAGPAGDLLIEVSVLGHPRFGRKGRDVTTTVAVTAAAAAEGTEVSAPTLTGPPVRLKVPAGSRHGTTLRAKGKGGPVSDLLVRLEIVDGPTPSSGR